MKQTLHDLFVDMLVNCLALWQELAVDDAPRIKECDQHDFDFELWLSGFLRPCMATDSSTEGSGSGLWVKLKDPLLITVDDSP